MRSGHFSRASARLGVSTALVAAATLLGVGSAQAAPIDPECDQVDSTVTCTYTVNDTFIVPSGVESLRILAVGGNGAAGTEPDDSQGEGGDGDAMTTDIPVGSGIVSAGDELTLVIGGNAVGREGGANGGADGGAGPDFGGFDFGGGGGGGATDVRVAGPDSRIAVGAGGGGGGVGNNTSTEGGDGGSANETGDDRDGAHGEPVGDGGGNGGSSLGAGGDGGISPNDPDPGDGQDASGGGGGAGGHGIPFEDGYRTGGGGGGGGITGGGGGGGGGVSAQQQFGAFAGGGGGAAGLSYTASGVFVSHAPADGTPRVVITYQAEAFEAVSDDYETTVDTLLTVPAPGVFDNDTGSAPSFTVEDDVDHGTLTPGADGAFTYQPAPGFEGLDTFSYSFTDEDAQQTSDTALVRIRVIPDFVTVDAACAEATFTNVHDAPIHLAYGSADIIAPDGELDLEPGESRTVETDRAELFYLAGTDETLYPEFDSLDVPQDCGPGEEPGEEPGGPGSDDDGAAGSSGGSAAPDPAAGPASAALPDAGAPVSGPAILAALGGLATGAALLARRRRTSPTG